MDRTRANEKGDTYKQPRENSGKETKKIKVGKKKEKGKQEKERNFSHICNPLPQKRDVKETTQQMRQT